MKSKIAIVVFAALSLMFINSCLYPGITFCKSSYKIGPFSGVVLDSQTRQPIKGAKVFLKKSCEAFDWRMLYWYTDGRIKTKKFYAETDEQGRYKISASIMVCCSLSGGPFLSIYKAGYVGYRNDLVFMGGCRRYQQRGDFKAKDNIAILEKWDDKNFSYENSHECHLSFIGCHYPSLHDNFCREAAKDDMMILCKQGNIHFCNILKEAGFNN